MIGLEGIFVLGCIDLDCMRLDWVGYGTGDIGIVCREMRLLFLYASRWTEGESRSIMGGKVYFLGIDGWNLTLKICASLVQERDVEWNLDGIG